ncbi:MAG: tyrosine-type recombinase/integrase [Lentisphaerae bacterium]|nr:tyrosine-type recombinase/integrase [Lentisphaerota bacterium]
MRYKLNGITRQIRLLTPDGKPIHGAGPNGKPLSRAAAAEARKTAEAAAGRHLSHIREADKVEQLKQLQSALSNAETAAREAEADLLNARATIADGWALFMGCPKRPASCRRYTSDNIPRNTTAGNYRGYYGRFIMWMNENNPEARLLSEVTPDMAAAFMDSIAATAASGTFNKYLQFFKCFYSTLADANKITVEKNPFADIEPQDGETHSKRPLSRQQISALLDTAEGELQVLIALGYFTGLRFGDCCTLRWDEVDLSRQIIERIPNKTARTIKDKAKATVKIGLAPYLSALLADLPRASEYVLPDMANRLQKGRHSGIHRAITSLFERCGIATRADGTGAAYHYEGKRKVYEKGRPRAVVIYGFHSLRYSYISHNAEAGTPAAIIQRNAGHSNPAMTEHYTRISDAAAVKYAKALDISNEKSAGDIIIEAPPATGAETRREQLKRIIDAMSEEQINILLEKMKQESHS